MTTLEDKQFVIYVINLIAFVIVVILSVIIVILILRNRVKSPPKEDIELEEIELKDKNHEQEEIYAEIDDDEWLIFNILHILPYFVLFIYE